MMEESTYHRPVTVQRAGSTAVVYFGEDNSTIHKDQLRTKIGIKETSDDALICYCFDVSRAAAQTDEKAKAFVVEQITTHRENAA